MSEFPDNGARFVLIRQRPAHYQVRVYEAPDRAHRAELRFDESGDFEIGWESAWPRPQWLDKYLNGLINQVRKSGIRDQIWPRRIRRWRDAA